MSRDLTLEEQRMFADKVGKPKDPVFMDPMDGQQVVLNPGSNVPKRLVRKGGRKTKKRRSQKNAKRITNARRTGKQNRLHKS